MSFSSGLTLRQKLILGVLVLLSLPWFFGGRELPTLFINALGIFAGLFFLLQLSPEAQRKLAPVPRYLQLLPAAALTAAALGSAFLFSINRYESVLFLAPFVLGVLALSLAARAGYPREFSRAYYLLIYAAASLASLYGLVHLTFFIPYDRLVSVIGWPNTFGGFLLFILPIGLYITLREPKNYLVPLAFSINLAAFLLTFSRGALLSALLPGVLFLLVFRKHLSGAIRPLAIAGGLTALLFLAVPAAKRFFTPAAPTPTVADRFSDLPSSVSTTDRLAYWEAGLNMIERFPLSGIGPGTFGTLHSFYQKKLSAFSKNIHNFHLQMFVEGGVAAGIFWLAFIAFVLFLVVRALRSPDLLAAAGLGLFGSLIHATIDFDYLYPVNLFLLFIGAGLLLARHLQIGAYIPSLRRLLPSLLIAAAVAVVVGSATRATSRERAAFAAFSTGDYGQAEALYRQAESGLVRNPEAAFRLGQLALRKESTGEARAFAEDALRRSPYDARYHFLLGRIAVREGDRKNAAEIFSDAIRLDRFNHPEYYLDLAGLFIEDRRFVEAQNVLGVAYARLPTKEVLVRAHDTEFMRNAAEARTLLAEQYYAAGNMARARVLISDALLFDAENRRAKNLQSKLGL